MCDTGEHKTGTTEAKKTGRGIDLRMESRLKASEMTKEVASVLYVELYNQRNN